MPSFELQDEIQGLQDLETYGIEHDHDFSSEDPEALLEAAVEAVAESSEAIRDSEVFDVYRSVLKHSSLVPGIVMTKLLDSISSGLLAELDATLRDIETGDQETYMSHKIPLEMYGFLLHWFVTAAEKVKASEDDAPPPTTKPKRGRGGKAAGRVTSRTTHKKSNEVWTWEDHIPSTLSLTTKVLRQLQTQRIWRTAGERDTFVNCITRPAYHVMESEQYMKSAKVKKGVFDVLCLSVKHHGQAMALQISVIQFLTFYEHLPETLAECLTQLRVEYDYAQLGDEIVREIAGKTFHANDNKGPRSFAKFLVKYAETCPRSVSKQLSLLVDQLDSESYPMRQAIIEVIGSLITELANAEGGDHADPKQTQKQISNLFNLLLERVLDNSSYVRSKVFAVLAKLVKIKTYKFPKQRLHITSTTVSALDDKNSSVRKAAASLLVQLLLTHPYILHGGMLQRDLWENEYKDATAALDKIEGPIGKAVEETGEQEEQQEAEEESNESKKKGKKRSKRSKEVKKEDDVMDVDEVERNGENEHGLMDVDEAEGNSENKRDVGGDTEEEEEMSADEGAGPNPRTKLKPRKSQLDVNALNQEQAVLAQYGEQEITQRRLQKKFCRDALTFIDEIENAMEPMCKLLGSKNKAEVLEVMDFFRVAHEYQFETAKEGVRKMLHLIWTKDNNTSTTEDGQQLKGIRQRLLECYRNLYFDPVADLDAREQVNRIAKNLIERTYGATLAELTSLEEMMRIMMEENQIHHDVISKLWQVYSKEKLLPKPQRRGAIIILGMLAIAKRGILTDKIDVMLRIGLGPLGRADLILARYTCVALQRLNGSAKKVKGSLVDNTQRIDMANPIFSVLQKAILHPCRSKEWFGMAEQIINTVYALGEHPDVLCNDVIKNLTNRVFNRPKTAVAPERPDDEQQPTNTDVVSDNPGDATVQEGDVTMMDATQPLLSQAPQDEEGGEKDVGEAFDLSQLLFVVGHVAIKHIVFLELVEREWKRQKDEKQAAEKKSIGNHKNTKEKEDELEQVAGNAEDEIGDRIAAVRETELLYGPSSLLAIYGPMLVHICGSPHKFKNRTLRAAAILSFSKFLCVSSSFCDQHHRLLFKILETSKDPNVRSNVVIALGDVAVSFSTIFDENSNELYKGLADRDFVVKKNTFMVLTHLILNGMIKVKGQLGEMAKCVEDEEPRIADLAKLFFDELATKDNAIYNNLPDVISHLSSGELSVEEEKFRSILQYIFKFIEKEKQAESIVEKLCQRFRLSEDPRQWRDIAFCLSLLSFKSERSVKKLIEGLQFYRDKLREPAVYERFTEILQKARANKSKDKPDSELDEFEKILEEHKVQGQEDQALEKRVEGKRAAARKRAAKKVSRTKKTARNLDEDMYDAD